MVKNSNQLIIRRDIVQHAKIRILDCDITFNKGHGIEIGCIRTTLRGCMVTDNYGLALKLQQESAKLLLRINDKVGGGSNAHES